MTLGRSKRESPTHEQSVHNPRANPQPGETGENNNRHNGRNDKGGEVDPQPHHPLFTTPANQAGTTLTSFGARTTTLRTFRPSNARCTASSANASS